MSEIKAKTKLWSKKYPNLFVSLKVEEKGLKNQINRIKDLIPSKEDVECNTLGSAKYLQEQLTTIVEDLEDIKIGIKEFNDGAES